MSEMSGHSHYANIAARKGVADAKRGKLFSKLSRYIIIAARNGGGDPDINLKLRYAIDKARSVSMPRDNIERAVKRGTGEIGAETFEELQYEGFGSGGVAIICDIMTDNRARSSGEVRKIYERGGGNMGGPGCVSYLFKRKGVFILPAKNQDEDGMMTIALEAGADDFQRHGDHFEVTCAVDGFSNIQEAFKKANITPLSAEMAMIADTLADVDVETGRKILKLMEVLDEHDDVQAVFSNMNLTDEIAASAG